MVLNEQLILLWLIQRLGESACMQTTVPRSLHPFVLWLLVPCKLSNMNFVLHCSSHFELNGSKKANNKLKQAVLPLLFWKF
jgi:hypothetical protein